MSAEADFIALLNADATVGPLVNGKIFLNAADEATTTPYIVVTGSHDPTYGLDNSLLNDHVTFTVACWCSSADRAEVLGDAVQASLVADPLLGMIARTGGFDEQTTIDVAVLTIDRL